jgi:adenosylcobinamide-GDP ribazoletransferase
MKENAGVTPGASVDRLARRPRAVIRDIAAELLAAVAFLTRLPVPGRAAIDARRTGASGFGLVGAAVGTAGALALVAVGDRAPLAAAALAIGAIAVVSGALHLDGLADTIDALAAPTPGAAARARKDPAVGPAGAVAIALVLFVDVALLATLSGRGFGSAVTDGPVLAALACIVAAAGSRALPCLAVVVWRRPAAPTGDGLGGWFARSTSRLTAALAVGAALAVAVAASVLAHEPGLVLGGAAGSVVGLVFAGWLARMRHGLDGDGLGAIVEVGFASILLSVVLAS